MIEVKNLTKRYGSLTAVDNISFSIKEGEIVGFLGPNGAGKSTTLNIITGYLSANNGTVTVEGFDMENDHIIEYSLKLDSNPEFTSSVITAYARALYKMYARGERGAITVFDVPPAMLSPKTPEELRKEML